LLVACFMRTCIFSMSSSVFFSCLLIHLDRHSFPTRRSSDLGTYKFYGNTDYYDILFKDRRSHVMHNLSVSGGSDKLRGVISGRIYKREKIQNIQDSDMKRYNLRLNLVATPYDWLELSATSKFSSRFDEEYAGTKNGWGGTLGVSKWRDLFPNYPAFVDGYG